MQDVQTIGAISGAVTTVTSSVTPVMCTAQPTTVTMIPQFTPQQQQQQQTAVVTADQLGQLGVLSNTGALTGAQLLGKYTCTDIFHEPLYSVSSCCVLVTLHRKHGCLGK